MPEIINQLIQGLATAIPVIVTSTLLLFKFKTDLCKQISDLTIKLNTHIKIADYEIDQLMELKERLTNVILKNKLKY